MASPASHPVVAVLDPAPDEDQPAALWHVQTDPAYTSAAAVLSGAWLIGPGEVPAERLDDLLARTVPVRLGTEAGERFVSDLAAAIDDARGEISRAAAKAAEESAAFKALRLPAVATPNPEELAGAYRGEERGRRAWSVAQAIGQLAAQWHDIERRRRSRRRLSEALGPEIRPLPLP